MCNHIIKVTSGIVWGIFSYGAVPRNWLTENMVLIYTWHILYRIAKLYIYALIEAVKQAA